MKNVETVEYLFGDKTYSLSALTIGDMAAFRDHLRQKKIATVRAAFEGLPEKTAELQKAVATPTTDADVKSAMSELSSVVFLLSRSLSRLHPEMTFEKAGELIPLSGMGELSGILSAMTGGGANNENPPTPQDAANR
jgi:hypothetical protein